MVNGMDSFPPLSEPNSSVINKQLAAATHFANRFPRFIMWVYAEIGSLNENCGLCINDADMTEITEFCNIEQYPKELNGA